jgi:hypothetical protein
LVVAASARYDPTISENLITVTVSVSDTSRL